MSIERRVKQLRDEMKREAAKREADRVAKEKQEAQDKERRFKEFKHKAETDPQALENIAAITQVMDDEELMEALNYLAFEKTKGITFFKWKIYRKKGMKRTVRKEYPTIECREAVPPSSYQLKYEIKGEVPEFESIFHLGCIYLTEPGQLRYYTVGYTSRLVFSNTKAGVKITYQIYEDVSTGNDTPPDYQYVNHGEYSSVKECIDTIVTWIAAQKN